MSIFEQLGLTTVINASGKMTALGASVVSEEVAQALKDASQAYVNIDEMIEFAGTVIADITGAEDGCPTNGAAAGIAISIAAVIAGENLTYLERLPNSDGLKNQVIIQKGQEIHFGASIAQMIRLGGGKVVEVGQTNQVEVQHIEEAINEHTAALIYIKSHHAVQKGMQPIETMIKLGKKHHIPLIIDAAAETDFRKYIAMGADIVIYSGSKALEGPTSGFICGKKELMAACKKQYKGIARPMKVSKEAMAGLIVALKQYAQRDLNPAEQLWKMEKLCTELNGVIGLTCSIKKDEAGREIYRANIEVDSRQAGMDAKELLSALESGNPAIFLRHHYVDIGIVSVDPRPLLKGQEDIITEKIKQIVAQGVK